MREKLIFEIEELYDLELDKIIRSIKIENAKKVLLQFPEGMKPYSQQICSFVEENTNCLCFIWIGSCYGACDIPEVDRLGIDLIIQFGHSAWKYEDIKVLK